MASLSILTSWIGQVHLLWYVAIAKVQQGTAVNEDADVDRSSKLHAAQNAAVMIGARLSATTFI